MDIFLTLLGTLIPLYAMIALGWIAGRFYGVQQQSLAALGIYILVPIVSFYYVASLEFKLSYLLLPMLVYCLSAVITLLFYALGKRLYPDRRANLLAMASGASNLGYLGVAITISLFPPVWVGVYVFALAGGLIYEATLFYYIANRGQFSPKDSLIQMAKYPVIYAILAGLLFNLAQQELPAQMNDFWAYFEGAYVVIGMMIIGLALSKSVRLTIAPTFLSLVFLAQFIIWPLVAMGLIVLDRNILNIFEPQVHTLLFIMAIMPSAANVAAFAALLDLNPEKAATTVLLGTLFALFYIPAMLTLYGI